MQRKQTYRCVGGLYDGLLCTLDDEKRIRLSTQQDAVQPPDRSRVSPQSGPSGADYDLRRLLAPDGKWHEFLVSSSLTTMQATVWLNRRQ